MGIQFFQTIGLFRKTAPFRCNLRQISDTKDVLYSEYQMENVNFKKKNGLWTVVISNIPLMDISLKSVNVHLSPIVFFNSQECDVELLVPFRKIPSLRRCKSYAITYKIIILLILIPVWQVVWSVWKVLPEQYLSFSGFFL